MIRSSKVQYFLGLGTCVHSWVLGHWREPARGMTGQKRNMFQNFQHHLEELIFVYRLHQRWLGWFKQKVQYRQFAYLWFIMVQHLIDFCQKWWAAAFEGWFFWKNVSEWHVQENTSKPSKKCHRTLTFLASAWQNAWILQPRFQGPRRRFGHHGSDGQDSRDESGNCVHADNFQNFHL